MAILVIHNVMAGLVPAIHVLLIMDHKDVDARHKAGHDESKKGPGKTGAFDLSTCRRSNQRE
jgi:hypothetical protein